MAGVAPHPRRGTHKGSLVWEWWQDALWDSWAQGWAGHSATGGPLRALSSESQLPLGWLAHSPAAWRGERGWRLCLSRRTKSGVSGRGAEGSSASSWIRAKEKQDPVLGNTPGLFEFFCCHSIKQDRMAETISNNNPTPTNRGTGGERRPREGEGLAQDHTCMAEPELEPWSLASQS